LTDFQNSFTETVSDKFTVKYRLSIKFPPHRVVQKMHHFITAIT